MAHDITATDGLVLHRQPAWHGLGVVASEAPVSLEHLTSTPLSSDALAASPDARKASSLPPRERRQDQRQDVPRRSGMT
jgi:hypothetical protein